MTSVVRQKLQRIGRRSIEFTREYVRRQKARVIWLWTKLSPRHPVLKVVTAPFVLGVMLAPVVVFVLIPELLLIPLFLDWALSKRKKKASAGSQSDGQPEG